MLKFGNVAKISAAVHLIRTLLGHINYLYNEHVAKTRKRLFQAHIVVKKGGALTEKRIGASRGAGGGS